MEVRRFSYSQYLDIFRGFSEAIKQIIDGYYHQVHQDNLATIRLPNEQNFVADPRPDVSNVRCMDNCRDASAITILSEVAPPLLTETVHADAAPEAARSATELPGG